MTRLMACTDELSTALLTELSPSPGENSGRGVTGQTQRHHDTQKETFSADKNIFYLELLQRTN